MAGFSINNKRFPMALYFYRQIFDVLTKGIGFVIASDGRVFFLDRIQQEDQATLERRVGVHLGVLSQSLRGLPHHLFQFMTSLKTGPLSFCWGRGALTPRRERTRPTFFRLLCGVKACPAGSRKFPPSNSPVHFSHWGRTTLGQMTQCFKNFCKL